MSKPKDDDTVPFWSETADQDLRVPVGTKQIEWDVRGGRAPGLIMRPEPHVCGRCGTTPRELYMVRSMLCTGTWTLCRRCLFLAEGALEDGRHLPRCPTCGFGIDKSGFQNDTAYIYCCFGHRWERKREVAAHA